MAIQTKGVIDSQAQSDFVRILGDQRIPKVTRFLDGVDLLNFEERVCHFIRDGVPKQPFNFLIGKATIPEGEDRLSIFMMVEKLVRSPAFPLRLPKFAEICSFSESLEAMKDLRRKLHSVENYFAPTTIEELRNQYWAIWQLTNLSHQWFRSIHARGLITEKTQTVQVKAEKLSFGHLRDRAWDTSVQIGECKIEGVVYQVRARSWFDDARDFTTRCNEVKKGKFYAKKGMFRGSTFIYLTTDPKAPVRFTTCDLLKELRNKTNEFFLEQNIPTHITIIHCWKNYGQKFTPLFFDNSEQDLHWDKLRDEVARPDAFYVDFNFQGVSIEEASREEGLNRLHHLKIMQVVFEILLRSERPITQVKGRAFLAAAPVLFASDMEGSWKEGEHKLEVLHEVQAHREQHGTLFPPYKHYYGGKVSIMRSKLESGETRPHVPIFEGKSWKQIIEESPILFGSGPVVPLYWSAPPACLKGRLRWDDSLMAAEAGPSSSAIASSSTAPLAASSSSDPAMGG